MTTSSEQRVRDAFLAAGDAAVELLAAPRTTQRWDTPSALEAWDVGGLAGHLGRAVLTVPRYLDAPQPPEGAATVDAPGYMLAAIDDDDLDVRSALYTAIRARGDEEAAQGPQALATMVARELEGLRHRLGPGPDRLSGDRLIAVLDGITMTLDHYLATRVVELVVHLDDLAHSIDRPPAIPAEALALATDVAVELGRRRRGDMTVRRAMARRERVPDGPIAF